MRLEFFFAYRYLISKKSKGIIHLISIISAVVVAFVTAAMVLVMSAFYGIEKLVDDLFAHFDAPLVVYHTRQKFFDETDLPLAEWSVDPELSAVEPVVENDVWIHYGDADAVVTMKGVSPSYGKNSGMDQLVKMGRFLLQDTTHIEVVPGLGVCGELRMAVEEGLGQRYAIRAPIPGRKLSRYKEEAFRTMDVYNAGVFSANAELDVKYVFVPLYNARKLLEKKDSVTAVELFLRDEAHLQDFQEKWMPILAEKNLKLVSRLEKNALIYKTTQSEKWATFAILFFILLIACFNIVASLSMMMIEKRNDIFVIRALGGNKEMIKHIFVLQGVLVNTIGALSGVLLGLAICWLQMSFGLVTMEGAVVENYPIAVDAMSILGIFCTVITTGSLFCWLMVKLLWKSFSKSDN